jgi:hypothetical protein
MNESRIAIYEHLKQLFATVSQNIYSMKIPTDTTADDTKNGFLVIRVGGINDESEFGLSAYGWVRCYVTAYVPEKLRGRLDTTKYAEFENGINGVISGLMESPQNTEPYYIMTDSVLSMDDDEDTIKGNQYNVFVKSFVVVINNNLSNV